MSALINTNGKEIKVEGEDVYINGKKVINNCVGSFGIEASTFFAGFVAGFIFVIVIAEIGKAI